MAGELPSGSLNGDESTGLTGAESAKGFRPPSVEAGLVGAASLLAPAPYGGGAVAVEADRLTAAAATPPAAPAATPPAMTCPMLGG